MDRSLVTAKVAALVACSAVVLTASDGIAMARGPRSGVRGQAILGPTCPVQRPGQKCERPYQTTLALYTVAHHRLVKTVRSHKDGHFRLTVGPGRYTLQGSHSGYPFARPVAVTVHRHRFTVVTVHFDTGIR